jgi:hypothetical protein
MKLCLECHTLNASDALTCTKCGGGSWGEIIDAGALEPMLELLPADETPKRGPGRPKKAPQ